MADVEVTYISKQPRPNAHEGITHLGNASGRWTRHQIVNWIIAGHCFYVLVEGVRCEIGVVNGSDGKHLRTHADGSWSDHLLSLPEWPAAYSFG